MYRKFFKRIIDLIIAIVALPFWLIILVIIGPIIYFQDKGPIFYNAYRLGKGGKVFKMYKFRSMILNAPDIRNADGSTFNAENDPRLTKIGRFIRKTSIDETPQLLNIIKGEMSLIGPRPDLPEHHKVYNLSELKKLDIRPGITGYNQAFFRNSITYKERWKNDIYYLENLTLSLDIKILYATITSVFCQRNIFSNGNEK